MKRIAKGSIRNQIMSGYRLTIILMVFLSIAIFGCVSWAKYDYTVSIRNQMNRNSIQSAIAAHYEWLNGLSDSIQTGDNFSGSLDPQTCSFGVWQSGVSDKDLENPAIRAELSEIKTPHERIHLLAGEILQIAAANPEEALDQYITEVKPLTTKVIEHLGIMDEYYAAASDHASEELYQLLTLISWLFLVVTIIAAILSFRYALKLSKRISRPITAVTDWAVKLSMGIENIEFEPGILDQNKDNEIGTMVRAFTVMAENIRENVEVIKRVAEGDMTAFVRIRSNEDSLGKNLYRMVQSNDLLYHDIVNTAHTVAIGAQQISDSSQTLAESASNQASAVEDLSSTIQYASTLVTRNHEKSGKAMEITNRIQSDSSVSQEKLKLLLESVEKIRLSSERISKVIKSIENIAFETNILSLNAGVEAARAGAAGKGFAVVADEVRSLAQKSAEAAKESRQLIVKTIEDVREGSIIAEEASNVFNIIINELAEIVQITKEVSEASGEQRDGIDKVNEEIQRISQSTSSNAAVSQEAAAASQEMNGNAEILRNAISTFHLRKRQPGQAYIPPEKKNDPNFINHANKAYLKSREKGAPHNEYIEQVDFEKK